jgi:predicted metal-dependent phosphoesterase TrpH
MRYDLHTHTKYSGDGTLAPAELIRIAKKMGLDGIAITDHNQAEGALKAAKLNRDKDFEVIAGEEISVEGRKHLLAYYINEKVKPGNILEVIDKLRQQGAILVPAHPFDFFRKHFSMEELKEISRKVDAVEVLNGRDALFFLQKAKRFAVQQGLAMTAGSDAHFSFEVGRARTVFEGSLRDAIRKRKTAPEGLVFAGYLGGALTFLAKSMKKFK